MSNNIKELHLSPSQIAWKRFKRHRLAKISMWIIIVLAILSILIPIISGHNVDQPNIMKIFTASSSEHLFGTDENGYDVFTRLFYGGRISLSVGLISALSAAIIGTLIGSMAAYFGGWIDSILMRITDTMLALPVLPLLIILSAIDYKKLIHIFFNFIQKISPSIIHSSVLFVDQKFQSFVDAELFGIIRIIFIISVFSWMSVARLVRGEVLSLKNREFIDASRSMGAGHTRIIFKHLIPNALTPVIISTTLSLGAVIQYEAVLSFFGLGIPSSTPSWGNMLSNSLEYFVKSPSFIFYPGLLISITVICINFIGDGLRDALDPRQILK